MRPGGTEPGNGESLITEGREGFMPVVRRSGKPTLTYEFHDFTDP